MINLFEEIKSQLSIFEVAERYGVKILKGNKAACPFHDDNHPSMSFKNNRFKCFACGIGGSVIDFVMNYFNLNATESAKKLNDDFNMGLMDTDLSPKEKRKIRETYEKRQKIKAIIGTFETWRETTEKWFLSVFKMFRKIFISFAPKNFEEIPKIWIIATCNLECVSFILDTFLSSSREKLLEEYEVIEGWKHKILKELEVF
ncbi:MAG: CHC2 zinc finger domain-containing protein [Clostridia bacterium]|nr:CHC2 zinc finger domain-containing protein [Clostridia bacterium]